MAILEYRIVGLLLHPFHTVPIFATASSLTDVFVNFGRLKGLGNCLPLWITVCLSAHFACLPYLDLVVVPSIRCLLRFSFENLQENQGCICCLNTKIDDYNPVDKVRQH